jgi:hypothetical protein
MTRDIQDEIVLMWFHEHEVICASENAYDYGNSMYIILEPMTSGLEKTCYK